MTERIAGFKGEYLWDLDIVGHHLRALAEAIPDERYLWRPADDARSVSEVLVHVAAGNFALLDLAGVATPPDIYPPVTAHGADRFFALVMRNVELEKSLTAKADVVALLHASLSAVRDALTQAQDLDRVGSFFGEQTTVRRVYLRILAHSHEHMGQLVAFVRAMGMKAPWADPRDMVKARIAQTGTAREAQG